MKGSGAVVERLAATAPADIAITQPVMAEIACGIERLPSSKRRSGLKHGRPHLLGAPRGEWTDAVSRSYGRKIDARAPRHTNRGF